jgi:hypothetical protein
MTTASPNTSAITLFNEVADRLAGEPGVTRAKMFGSPCLKIGGKVFATFWKDTLVVKLPAARVDESVAAGAGERFDPGMGRLMKEWVAFSPSTSEEWLALAIESRAFVAPAA